MRREHVFVLAAIISFSLFLTGHTQTPDPSELGLPTDPPPNPDWPWNIPPEQGCLIPQGWETPCCHGTDPSSEWDMGFCFNGEFESLCLNTPLGICGNVRLTRAFNEIEREYSLQLLRGIRAARLGLRPIVHVTNLSALARAHACYLYNSDPSTARPGDWKDNRARFIQANAIPYHLYAGLDDIAFPVIQNIDELDAFPSNPSDAMADWLSNERTRAVLRGNFNSIGVGVYAPTQYPAALVVILVNVVSGLDNSFPGN